MNNSQLSNDPKGHRIALERIEREAHEKTGILNLGGLGLVEPPPELFQLKHLRCLSLGSGKFSEGGKLHYGSIDENERLPNQFLRGWAQLASFRQLAELSIYRVPCENLFILSGLTNLQLLDCSFSQVSDLAPLSGLTSLQSLNCSSTLVSDLSPLSNLKCLRSLTFWSTKVTDISPLSGLTNLQSLDFSDTLVSELNPLIEIPNLHSLDFSATKVNTLSPISGLTSIQSLN